MNTVMQVVAFTCSKWPLLSGPSAISSMALSNITAIDSRLCASFWYLRATVLPFSLRIAPGGYSATITHDTV
jgi:hypothetical protein